MESFRRDESAAPVRLLGRSPSFRMQQGWVGLVVLLLALVIVGFLAKDALKKYGLGSAAATAGKANAGTAGEGARTAGAVGAGAAGVGGAAPAPAAALERARGVEDMVKQQAEERAARVDAQAK